MPAKPKLKIALARMEDVDLLVKHRLRMFEDLHPDLKTQIHMSKPRTTDWITRKLKEGKLIGFIVRTEDGLVAGSGCLWLREQQPRIVTPLLEAPYLMSMFTKRGFRRRGVASLIIKCAIAWCRGHGYNGISLHASVSGKQIYDGFGFEPTNEMRLTL
jgi:GNAT superfamily N-acetyltransferase